MNNQVRNWLGLAKKAGKLALGSAQVEALIKSKRGSLLILAQDAPGLIKKFRMWGQDTGLQVLIFSGKDELGRAVGRATCGVMLVLDPNLAQAVVNAQGQIN